ncbi:MAG: SPFH domain-containing protein, partial [Armatimonadetes bacterium]|nr:SPFH domain-containing protein [Armatimonadota bacterium]
MPRLLDVIEYHDPTGQEIVHKIPEMGPADIRMGAQLVVQETQAAVFFRDGRALDVFGPGRHTLTTQNLPLLDTVVKFVAGGNTPFQAEVVFVNQKVFQDLKWGTPQPIDLTDPDLGWVSLRAFGSFSIRVFDPMKFITTLAAQQSTFDTSQLNSWLKGSIRTRLNDLLATNFTSYAKIRRDFEELSAAMKMKVKEDFAAYGIELRDFYIQDISVPPEVQEAFKERAKMGALGDLNKYTQYQAAQAMRDMANNPNAGGGAMGMGAGMGMGMMMPQMIQNAMGGGQQAQAPGPPAAPAAPAVGAAAGAAGAA